MQRYWLREELGAVGEDLLTYVPALLEEFLAYHKDFIDGDYEKRITVASLLPGSMKFAHSDESQFPWLTEPMKYTWKSQNVNDCYYMSDHARQHFPTACSLTEKYTDVSGMVGYSILEKNAVIERHTGRENRDNEFVRIHVPLLIPDGDIFFECEGYEIDWADIWGFDNQLTHSAHNHSPYRRLVFLIDISREYIGLPQQPPYDPQRELGIPAFERGRYPRILHSCQK